MASSIYMRRDNKRNDNDYQLSLFKVMSRSNYLRLLHRQQA